jgi:hypothetical protein
MKLHVLAALPLNIHWIGGPVGPTANPNDVEKGTFLMLLGLKTQSSVV